MENNELKEIDINNYTCYYFHDVIKSEDFDFNIILTYVKAYKNVLVFDTSQKTFFGSKPLGIRLDEVDGFIRVYDGYRYLYYLVRKLMMLFTIEFDI